MGITEEQLHDYKEGFLKLDTEGTGVLTKREYVTGLEAMGFSEDAIKSSEKFISLEDDGKMRLDEFIDEFVKIDDDEFRDASYRMLFKRVDQDGNGTISREEFPEIFKARNITFGEAEIDRWFRVMDKDKSGTLTYAEALKVIKKIVR